MRDLTRRRLLGSAAAVVAGPALAACAQSTKSGTAGLQTAQPVTTVYFQINWQQSWNKTAQVLCQEFTDANFNTKNKGVRAVPLSWGNGSGIFTEVLSGYKNAPAVVSGCCSDFATQESILAPLDPFLRKDNMTASLWSAGQLLTYELPNGLYGVPAYTACQPLIYSQTIFDELGLSYPDPEWDYKEAARIWTQLAGESKGLHRYGTTMQFYTNNYDGQVYLDKGWGGNLMDATKTVCLLDQPPSIAARTWIYPLVWQKIIINRGGVPGSGAQAVAAGRVAMYESAGDMLFDAVTHLGDAVKWDVIRMPSWPVRRGTNVQVDYYGINAHYPDQDLAWELFKFVAAGEAVNRFLVSATLSFPNLVSMWDEWIAIVRSVAPITRNKHIEYWAEAAQQGYGYGHEFFLYAPNQAMSVMAPILQQMWDRKLDPTLGCRQMAQQVNALEKTSAVESGMAANEAKIFPTTGPTLAAVTPGL